MAAKRIIISRLNGRAYFLTARTHVRISLRVRVGSICEITNCEQKNIAPVSIEINRHRLKVCELYPFPHNPRSLCERVCCNIWESNKLHTTGVVNGRDSRSTTTKHNNERNPIKTLRHRPCRVRTHPPTTNQNRHT